MNDMRKKLFYWIVRPFVPEGYELPLWAVLLRWSLFPLDTTFWILGKSRGYQPLTDTWLIEGVRYSGAALHRLAAAQGEIYRIVRIGDSVTVNKVEVYDGRQTQ